MKYERTSSSPRMAVEETHDDVKRRGRRVVATTALQPGDAIYAAPPDLAILYSPFARHVCARCLVAEVPQLEKGHHKTPLSASKAKAQGTHSHGSGKGPTAHGAAAAASSCPSAVCPTSAPSSSSSPPSATGGETASTIADPTEAVPCNPYVCPHCDQFVLCDVCVAQLAADAEALLAAEAAGTPPSSPDTPAPPQPTLCGEARTSYFLKQHPLLRAHAISCAWYTSLPESIRAPGNDTDFLRFCLDYGARVQLGDATMVAALNRLDTNAAVQSKEAHHLCEVFARDRVVATFGPHHAADNAAAAAAATSTKVDGTSEKSSLTTASALPLACDEHAGAPPAYPVSWTDLRDVLLRTRCNSLGFPFTLSETIGWSLQDTVCMLNHSCVPNAAVVMLYDVADEQRRVARKEKEQEKTAGAEEETSGTRAHDRQLASSASRSPPSQQSHGQRRGQRLSVSPNRSSNNNLHDNSTNGDGSTSGSTIKNLSSFRAIAVSSPSPFSTSYTETLRGWIGIQATRPIAAGEEITVSYIDLEVFGDDVQARSRHLLEQYRFLCTCELCTRQRGRKL